MPTEFSASLLQSSVTWSFRNHSNRQICCSKALLIIIRVKNCFFRILSRIEKSKEIEIFYNTVYWEQKWSVLQHFSFGVPLKKSYLKFAMTWERVQDDFSILAWTISLSAYVRVLYHQTETPLEEASRQTVRYISTIIITVTYDSAAQYNRNSSLPTAQIHTHAHIMSTASI